MVGTIGYEMVVLVAPNVVERAALCINSGRIAYHGESDSETYDINIGWSFIIYR
jgi:hypothetical protein